MNEWLVALRCHFHGDRWQREMRGSGSHESSGKFRQLFIGCCSSVYGNASAFDRAISPSPALRGTALPGETLLMLCFNPDSSCCSGWCRKSTGQRVWFIFFLSLNLSESASAEHSRNLPASAHGISSTGRRSGTARTITGIFGPENVCGRAQIQLCPVCF